MAKLQFKESFSMAMGSLRANKMRSALTLLGIVIGVLTIISVVSVIQGLDRYVATKMATFGANDFSVSKMSFVGVSLKDIREQFKRKDLTLAEMRLVRERCPSCDLVGASASTSKTATFRNRTLKDVEIQGVTANDHLIGAVIELQSGRQIQRTDEEHSRPVCIIGAEIAEKVFEGVDPLGRRLKIGRDEFIVIGVGAQRGKIFGFSQDNYARIPISTFHKTYGSRRSININIHTSSPERMAEAQEEVRTVLRSWRKRAYKDPDDFSILTSDTFVKLYKTATRGVFFAMIAIASIALLVGGIVIMNIMFVSVTERTKEIGIRIAVGARRRDILSQFLIEAVLISTLGGIIGILLGLLAARIVSHATSIPTGLEPVSIVAAVLVSMTTGLFFGLMPANRAAKLDPIEALRTEQ